LCKYNAKYGIISTGSNGETLTRLTQCLINALQRLCFWWSKDYQQTHWCDAITEITEYIWGYDILSQTIGWECRNQFQEACTSELLCKRWRTKLCFS